MMPAYLANPAASLIISFTGQGVPIDFGQEINGKRILGDGKTFKGFFAGAIFGIAVAAFENFINSHFLNKSMPIFTFIPMITLPFGAMIGDLVASMFKRRLNLERGQAFPIVDQLDFVFGAWIVTIIFAFNWFFANFTTNIIVAALILTPILHLLTNLIGYKLGLSREPW